MKLTPVGLLVCLMVRHTFMAKPCQTRKMDGSNFKKKNYNQPVIIHSIHFPRSTDKDPPAWTKLRSCTCSEVNFTSTTETTLRKPSKGDRNRCSFYHQSREKNAGVSPLQNMSSRFSSLDHHCTIMGIHFLLN